MVDAGYPQIPVIAISTQGLEDNPGFKATLPLLHRAIKALILGDLLMKCLYRVRPYEVEKGSANKLYELWDTIVRETIEHHGYSKTAAKAPGIRKGYLPYNVLAKEIVKSFDNLPLRDIPRKVRVGVVGEILVKYQPDANNHVVDVIESQHHGIHDHPPLHHRLEREEPWHGRQQDALRPDAQESRSV